MAHEQLNIGAGGLRADLSSPVMNRAPRARSPLLRLYYMGIVAAVSTLTSWATPQDRALSANHGGGAAPSVQDDQHFDSAFNNPALPGCPFYEDIQMGMGCGGTIQGCANCVRDNNELVVDKYPLVPWEGLIDPQDPPRDARRLEPIRLLLKKLLVAQRKGNPAVDHATNWRGTVLLTEEGTPNTSPGYRSEEACRAPWRVPNSLGLGPATRDIWCRFVALESGTEFYVLAPGSMQPASLEAILVEEMGSAQRTLIRPFTGRLTLDPSSSCAEYDADVLLYCRGTTGFPMEKPRMPSIEIQTAAMDQQNQLGRDKPNSFWFHRGSLVEEALSRGNIVVIPNWQLGRHPIPHSLAELIEIVEFLRNPNVGPDRFYNSFTKTKDGTHLELRFFCSGASYGGLIALSAALYFPWMVHGAIVQDANPDLRKQFSFQAAELKFFQSQSMAGDHFSSTWGLIGTPDTQRLLNELSFGYKEWCGVAGSFGNPVDMLGLSLLGQDLSPVHYNALHPNVRLTILNGDEDAGMRRNAGGLILAHPNADQIDVFGVPLQAHATDNFPAWNENARILTQLIDRSTCSNPAIPANEVPDEAMGISWGRHVGCPDAAHPSAPLRSEEDWPALQRDVRPEANHDPGTLSVTVLDSSSGTEWPNHQVWEGLGGSGEILLHDGVSDIPGTGSVPELYASTSRGDVVCIQFTRAAPDAPIDGVQEVWRAPVVGDFGGGEVFHASSELELTSSDPPRILAFNLFGPLEEFAADTGASTELAVAPGGPGIFVRSVEEQSADVFTALNALGMAVRLVRSDNGITVESEYFEGGITTITSKINAPNQFITGSAQGNWKGVNDPFRNLGSAAGGHPTNTEDISPYLDATPLQLIELPTSVKSAWSVDYLSLTEKGPAWRLATIAAGAFLRDWNEEEIVLQCSGRPPIQTHVLDDGGGDLELLLALRELPGDVASAEGVDGPGLVFVSLPQSGASPGPFPDFPDTETGVMAVADAITALSTPAPMDPNQIGEASEVPERVETVEEMIARIPVPPRPGQDGALQDEEGDRAPPRGTLALTAMSGPPNRRCDFTGDEYAYLDMSSPPTAIGILPAGFPLKGIDDGEEEFEVFAVVTRADGVIVLIGDPRDVASPSGGRIDCQVLDHRYGGRIPFGSCFSIAEIDEGANRIAVLTRDGRAFKLDENGVVDPQVFVNATTMATDGGGFTLGKKAHRAVNGAVYAHGHLFGMFDGGDALLTASPPLLAFPSSDPPSADPRDDWAGLRVVELEPTVPHFNYFDGDGFKSGRLLSTASTARPEVVRGGQKGNSAKWVNVNGDQDFDIVFGAYGGKLHLFENWSEDPGAFVPGPTCSTTDLGLSPMSISSADLDRDSSGEELIVALRETTDPSHPTEFLGRGSLVVLDYQGGLQEVARYDADELTGGFVGARILQNPLNLDPPVDYCIAGATTGRVYLFEVTSDLQLELKYESPYLAPCPGAYGAIAQVPIQGGGEQVGTRVVLCSPGGLICCDVTRTP